MKKLISISLILLSNMWTTSYAGIIGVTRWVKDKKTVCIYFDSHDKGTAQENLDHINYLKDNVFNKAPQRTKPLLVLVENFMREQQYKNIAQRVEQSYGLQGRLLQQFNPWVDKDLHGPVTIKSIEARVVPTITYPLICEWRRRCTGIQKMSNDLYTPLDETFKGLTFGQVFARAKQINDYVEKAPITTIKNIFLEQKAQMFKFVNTAAQILLQGGFSMEEIKTKPIKTICYEIAELSPDHSKSQAWDNLFINFRGQDFWPIDLLWQLTNAHMLWEIIQAKSDVALFTGSYHAVTMENCLKELGYNQTGVAQKQQVEIERHNFSTDDDHIDKNMNLISFAAYKWIE